MHGMRINIQNLRLKQLMKSNIIKSTTVNTCWYAPWEHRVRCSYWHGVYIKWIMQIMSGLRVFYALQHGKLMELDSTVNL